MIKIILVGDIGSGKTHVSKLFKAPCFFADTEVKNLYRNNKQCFIKLKNKFPQFIKTFPIKKIELSNTIKNRFSNLKSIGFIVHPFIRKKLRMFLKKNRKKKIVVLDEIVIFFKEGVGILLTINRAMKIVRKGSGHLIHFGPYSLLLSGQKKL